MSSSLFGTRKGAPHGRLAAAQAGGGVLQEDFRRVLGEFHRFKDESARAAFADKWVRLASMRLNDSWPVLYELLRIIRDEKLYANASHMEDKTSRESFEDYWGAVVQKPFKTWLELEETYHFVEEYAPDLMGKTFGEATAARERVKEAARKTTGEVNQRGGDRKSEVARSKVDSTIDSQVMRASENGVSRDTQKKLDRLARNFPDLHARVVSGDLSANRACIEAGIVRPTVAIPLDVVGVVRVLVCHFKGDDLRDLIRRLEAFADEP